MAVCATPSFASSVQGFETINNGGYTSTAPQGFERFKQMTVQEVKDHGINHQEVTLVGRLVNYIEEDKYEFQDQTGSITVELDDDQNWQHISKGQLIQIYGDVDQYIKWLKIEVKSAHPVQQ